jgi:RNA polymerase-binding protein DksA
MVAKKTAAAKPASARSTGVTAGKAAAKKTAPAKQTAVAHRAPAKRAAAAAQGAAAAAEQTGVETVVTKKTAGGTAAARRAAGSAPPKARVATPVTAGELPVRPGEEPWTPEEVAEARAGLQSEDVRLGAAIAAAETALAGLMRDPGDGAGDDQADTGTKNITRESELALAANARETLEQTERALERLDSGTYGLCEHCGKPIGKARMLAFPRATLCVECKQKQERR